MGGCSIFFLPRLFCLQALSVFVILCLLVVGSLGSARTLSSSSSLSSQETLKHHEDHHHVLGSTRSDKSVNHNQELDFNYMSKRRVPNGPDPIHNRRAGNSGRPPGQA